MPATRCHEPALDIVAPFGAVARRRTIAPETARRRVGGYAALLQATCFRPSFRFLLKNECLSLICGRRNERWGLDCFAAGQNDRWMPTAVRPADG